MDSSAPEEVTEKSLSETAVISEVRDLAEIENTKPAQIPNSKIGIDAEQIRSSISRLTSNSIDELEKLISKLQELQEFLTSETKRVQGEIGSVLNGVRNHNRSHCSMENRWRRQSSHKWTRQI